MKLFVTGSNKEGQLNRTSGALHNLVEMKLNFKIKRIACGFYHVLILTENNELYGCGSNLQGELGLINDTTTKLSNKFDFTRIDNSKFNGEIKLIECGAYYSTLLTTTNEFYLTGKGAYGQLGFGNTNNILEFTKNNFNFGKIKLIKCGSSTTIVLNKEGNLYVSGVIVERKKVFNFKQVFYCNPDIVDICCGGRFILILDKFGKAFKVNALDSVVQIEIPSIIGSIKQIAYAHSRFYILNDKNNLFEYFAFSKDAWYDSKTFSYLNINRIYSGFGRKLYLVACDIDNSNEEYLSVTDEFNYKDITELTGTTMNGDMERYLFPIMGYNFAYVVNTNNLNCFEESKEIERMKYLLFKLLQHGGYCKNSFKDISISYYENYKI